MLQRVGLAQALLNDPEVVFLDEPMSGLDPIGRRQVRRLILDLRDRGCTVFFSSHILADAEALCSRVAILARGRLAAEGRLSDILAFRRARLGTGGGGARRGAARDARGHAWPAGHASPTIGTRSTCPATRTRNSWRPSWCRAGVTLVSLNPVRETLEDFFMKHVAEGQRANA